MQKNDKVKGIVIAILALSTLVGFTCNRGDFKVTPVVEGQAAPHSGFNFGPDSYLHEGQPVKITGIVISIKGIDPNEIFLTDQ